MITYVNTVLVGTNVGTLASSISGAANGQYIVVDNDGTIVTPATAMNAEAIKVGLKTKKGVKWSNIIKKEGLKSYHFQSYKADTEDEVTFDFAKAVSAATDENIRIVVRLTFKDMPTRYRKWTESYEIMAKKGSIAKAIVDAFVKNINEDNKNRARVIAKNTSDKLVITAMAYDDDDSVNSISPANKVRFSANAWYTTPEAKGFASKNKYAAAIITKTPGEYYTASAKLVRDAEAQAMGYQGILNRGEGTWPIVMPEMNTVLEDANGDPTKYDSLTLEFENMYRSADDLHRRTKQTLQIFDVTTKLDNVKKVIEGFIAGVNTTSTDATAAQIKPNTSDVND